MKHKRKMKKFKSLIKTVYFGGTFDILNWGHCKAFEMCKRYGDYLIVGLNTDKLVRSYKQREPVLPYVQKKFILESIKYVDNVIPVHHFSPMNILKEITPDVFCVGNEWVGVHKKEISFVRDYGGEIRFIPDFKGVVHTSAIKKILLEEALKGVKD